MTAVLSDCGRYRYTLRRGLSHDLLDQGGRGTVLFLMLNPSTADASEDDPTIRRCIGFAKRWGFDTLTVGNLFAYRATDPRELRRLKLEDAAGPDNDFWLRRLCEEAGLIVAAWGAHRSASYRMPWVEPILAESAAAVVSFLMARAVVPLILEGGGGQIVNISMSEQTMVRRGFVPYGPAGAGVEALSRVMGADLAGNPVTVNILLPGGATRTGMLPDDVADELQDRLLDPGVRGPPIVLLASERAVHVHDRRIVANEFDPASGAS